MYIIGTSGHIDHGKTSLIAALSGINCDRLPEEQKREMTIDLGFAYLDFPNLGKVSIIDVPGHERFIRNMVSGAWGVDLGLLVIAADDGWMSQTEDHFKVLQFLGIPKIMIVINKIDLVDQEIIDFLKEEIKEKTANLNNQELEISLVSAKTGEGLDQLKKDLLRNLKALPPLEDEGKPFLYVDRSFAIKGFGTVVTGTLKNGFLEENDLVSLWPLKKEARVKKIESHSQTKKKGNPSQRTALNLSSLAVEEIKRGTLLYKDNFFTETKDLIVSLQFLNNSFKTKKNLEINIFFGTSALKGKCIFFKEAPGKNFIFARLKLDQPFLVYPSQRFVFTKPGGYKILGGGRVLLPDYDSSKHKEILKETLKDWASFSLLEIIKFLLITYQVVSLSDFFVKFPQKKEAINKHIQHLEKEKIITQKENYIFKQSFFENKIKILKDQINSHSGINLQESSSLLKTSLEITSLLIFFLLKEGFILEKNGLFFKQSSLTEENLSPIKKEVLTKALNLGRQGLELQKFSDQNLAKDIRDLIKSGFLISLDGNLVYHLKVYQELKDLVLRFLNDNEKITLGEAKDLTALSRKYIIPLLNRIERDGLIKRLGDFRVKA